MKKLSISFLVIMLVMVVGFNTQASDITAKAFGTGGAYTGLSDDATAMLYNPAGLSDSGFLGLQFEFGMGASDISKINDLMEDIEYFQEEFDTSSPQSAEELFNDFPVVDVDNQLFAGGNFSSFGVGLNIDNEFTTEKTSPDVINAFNTANTSGILSISRKLKTDYNEILGMSYGVNVKTLRTDYLNVELDKANYTNTIISASGSGVGLDAGVMVNFTSKLKIGASFKNIVAPDYELEGEKEVYEYDTGNEEWNKTSSNTYTNTYIPEQSYRVGASLDIPVANATLLGDIENFTTSGRTVTHLGVEKRLLFNGLSVRGGMSSPSDQDTMYTLGLGYNLAAFHFDMALGSNDGFDNNLNGILSLNFQF